MLLRYVTFCFQRQNGSLGGNDVFCRPSPKTVPASTELLIAPDDHDDHGYLLSLNYR
jgi:hypothetical protein